MTGTANMLVKSVLYIHARGRKHTSEIVQLCVSHQCQSTARWHTQLFLDEVQPSLPHVPCNLRLTKEAFAAPPRPPQSQSSFIFPLSLLLNVTTLLMDYKVHHAHAHLQVISPLR